MARCADTAARTASAVADPSPRCTRTPTHPHQRPVLVGLHSGHGLRRVAGRVVAEHQARPRADLDHLVEPDTRTVTQRRHEAAHLADLPGSGPRDHHRMLARCRVDRVGPGIEDPRPHQLRRERFTPPPPPPPRTTIRRPSTRSSTSTSPPSIPPPTRWTTHHRSGPGPGPGPGSTNASRRSPSPISSDSGEASSDHTSPGAQATSATCSARTSDVVEACALGRPRPARSSDVPQRSASRSIPPPRAITPGTSAHAGRHMRRRPPVRPSAARRAPSDGPGSSSTAPRSCLPAPGA